MKDSKTDNQDFENWVDFIFGYLSDEDNQADWYAEYGITKRFGSVFAEKCVRLFGNPEILLNRYTDRQIEKGFVFILGPSILIRMWLWDKSVEAGLRREFVLSMVDVFEKIFSKKPYGEACFMWWDYLRGFSQDKDLQVMDWMFAALSEILRIDSVDCQMSALHGLGHIEHPEKKELIENFLAAHPDFAKKDFALSAIDGNVM